MTDPQECFAEDCAVSYHPAALERTGNRCPGCGVWSMACPACGTIVEMDAILDTFTCPYCGAGHDELRAAVQETEVVSA